MKMILKEPLVHFLLIGAALFLLYGIINTEKEEREINIDDNLVNELLAKWELTSNRKPSLEEIEWLIDQYVQQEVFYREALAMNLDHNDEIVKRRLAQKMEFISDGLAESLQPTQEILLAYYEENKERYKKDPSYSLKHVYFSEDKRNNAFEDASIALSTDSPESLGDWLSLPDEYELTSSYQIARDYGSVFVKSLDTLELGKWTGPIYSGFGIHIVFMKDKTEAGNYNFEEVVEKVNRDYNFDASNDFKLGLITTLLKNYNVIIDVTDVNLKKELDEKF